MTIKERSTKIYRTKTMFSEKELIEKERVCIHEELPYCSAACPLKLDVRALVGQIAAGDFTAALALYTKITPLPHILSQGCEAPCQKYCKLYDVGEGIRITALERAATKLGEIHKGTGMLRMKKKKSVAIFGEGLFVAFFIGEMARKMYPVTVYSKYDNMYDMLKTAVPFADEEGVAEDAAVIKHTNITFVYVEALTLEFFEQERCHYDLIGVSPSFLQILGGEVDEAVMLWHTETIISAPIEQQEVIENAFSARKAALTADRLAQGLAPENSRGEEGCTETRLYTNLNGVAASSSIPCGIDGRYTREDAIREAKRCIQCHCDECIRGCVYLQYYKKYPKKLTREIYNNANIIMGDHMMNKPINACSLCRQCTVTCPNGYNMADICLIARQNMVTTGKMPLAPHEFALMDMQFSNTDAFLCRKQAGYTHCQYVFFPGCQTSAIAPDTVYKAYLDLTQRLTGGVALLLGCCGAIAKWAGRELMYAETVCMLNEHFAMLEHPVIIAGCPMCADMLTKHSHEQVIGIWDILAERGLPEGAKGLNYPVAMHDSCGARGNAHIQKTMRLIAKRLGCVLVDTEYSGDYSPCCGYGGLVMYANREVAHEMAKMCVERSDTPYITYCMACRDRLAREGKESRHLLELIYNENVGAPPDISEKRYNRIQLKERLLREVWKELVEPVKYGFKVIFTPEARRMMDDRMILRTDVMQTLQYMRETKEVILEEKTGLLITRHRDGNVTFWVKYEQKDDVYVVHCAYSHRMNIVTR
ncbi:pyridine nucleotide-disulfide oxidoreductase/dicluster-binding protein [Megasphaera sueciensis]|jgi:Fe-S oxidoreductase|uniref:pyridine nucleotide-disulfide oxidoreductase/dicluster-binding protein n=1 Tax=Megasphaera sueciensis TaxID=349094 RepID=UPI003CFF942C|nr:4Fe-4S dicluster domain-containing protein [Megasphaera sp.]